MSEPYASHAYVYDGKGVKHEAEPILRPAITWGEPIIPKAPWERPEDYSPAMHVFSAGERGAFVPVPDWPDYDEQIWDIPPVAYRVDVRFSNGVTAVISFPSYEACDAFLSGEDIEAYRL
jgi:hypothetical protein